MRYTWTKAMICISLFTFFMVNANAQLFTYKTNKVIVSVTIVDRTLEVIYREYQPCFAAVNPGCKGHTKIWKEIYRGKPGEVYLWKTIEGKLKDAEITTTPEIIEWPE